MPSTLLPASFGGCKGRPRRALLPCHGVFFPLLWALFAPPSPLPADAPSLTDVAPEPEPIVGGIEVEGLDHIETVYLRIGAVACTGTLLGERLVITAAHCLETLNDISRVCVLLGDEVVPGACWGSAGRTDALSFGIFPDYCTDCERDAADIGYLWLEQRVTGLDFPTVITDQGEYEAMMFEDAKVEFVGYGYDESGTADGKKRQVNSKISEFVSKGREFFAGGGGKDTCSGDSGGPVFMRADDGTLRLVGITSRGYPECGSGGLYTAPFPSLCWIRDETGVDLLPEGCENCDCVDLSETGGCGCTTQGDSGHAWLLLLALVGLGRRRRPRP